MIFFYKYLGILLIPFIKLNVIKRVIKGKEIKNRFKERYGITYQKKPQRDVIWIHAASIGEFKSADLIINSHFKKYSILVTTTTVSAANYALKHYGDKIIHQFAPLDVIFWVEKFLSYWNPKLVIWIESDLWPITTKLIKQKKIKAILLNVRMSPQSFNKWKKFKFFYRQMTDCFSEIFAQSQIDKNRIQQLAQREIKFIGNLKLSSINNHNDVLNHKLMKQRKPSFMLASTHEDEEYKILPVIKKLLSEMKDLKIIIAPRHPERSNTILSLFEKNHLSVKIEDNQDNNQKDILIVNSFGNLSKYFRQSDIVFLGGSFVVKGGHNPIEPAINSCVIMTGPYIYNWQNIYDDMLKNKACLKFNNVSDLEKNLRNILNNNELMEIMKVNAISAAQKKYFDHKKLFDTINNKLENVNC